jgi:small GTP-binding protein
LKLTMSAQQPGGLRVSVFQEAPENVLDGIAAFCDSGTVRHLARTCRRLRKICARELNRRPAAACASLDSTTKMWLESTGRGSVGLSVKIVLLGDGTVGKSSIAVRFTQDTFASSALTPTIGATFCSRIIPLHSAMVRLEIWDTSGQTRYRSLAPMYYRGAQAVIVVCDSPASLKATKGLLKELPGMGSGCQRILCVNKVDSLDARAVSKHAAEEFGKRHGVPVFEVSAKTGTGIAEMFLFAVMRVASIQAKLASSV